MDGVEGGVHEREGWRELGGFGGGEVGDGGGEGGMEHLWGLLVTEKMDRMDTRRKDAKMNKGNHC